MPRRKASLPVPRIVLQSTDSKTYAAVASYREADADFKKKLDGAMSAEGWALNEMPGVPPLDGVAEARYYGAGTDLFWGWTPANKRRLLPAMKRVSDKLGVPLYTQKLTLADCL